MHHSTVEAIAILYATGIPTFVNKSAQPKK